MDNREFMQFQQNLRRTALGVRFGKELLTNPDGLSAETITKVLKAMGLNLPPEVKMGADAAQALITGHAAIEAYETAKTASDYREIITMSANSTRTLTMVAERLEWIDSDTASILAIGADIACLIGSAGADVGAWIRIAMSIGMESAQAEAEAEMFAKKAVVGAYQEMYQRQIQNFTQSLKDLEAGKIGIFGFLVANAGRSNMLFNNVITNNPAMKPIVDKIPGLKLLPVGSYTWTAEGSSTTWWGETKTDKESLTVPALGVFDPAKATDFLLHWLIEPSALTYMHARSAYLRMGKADIFNVALLAVFEPEFYLKRQMSVLDQIVRLQLSPSELGEMNVFQTTVKENFSIMSSFGLTKKEEVFTKAQLEQMDLVGNISALRGNRLATQQMQQRFDFGELPEEKGNFGFYYGQSPFDWRNMANFVSVLDFLDLVYSDPDYENFAKTSDSLFKYDVFPKILDFKARYEVIFKKSLIRRVNVAAKANVAYFLNAPISKIEANTREGDSTVFKTK